MMGDSAVREFTQEKLAVLKAVTSRVSQMIGEGTFTSPGFTEMKMIRLSSEIRVKIVNAFATFRIVFRKDEISMSLEWDNYLSGKQLFKWTYASLMPVGRNKMSTHILMVFLCEIAEFGAYREEDEAPSQPIFISKKTGEMLFLPFSSGEVMSSSVYKA